MAHSTPGGEIQQLLHAASTAYGRRDYAAAAGLCQRVLQLEPNLADALHLLGLCCLAEGDTQQALSWFERAATLKPNDAQLSHNLGIARSEHGDILGARAAFMRAAALNPGHVDAQFNVAVTSEEAGDVEAAERAYRSTLALDPSRASAAAALAALCEQHNDLDEAARWAGQALGLDPADAVANLTQAQLDFRAGLFTEAAVRLERLLQQALTSRNRALAAGRLGATYDRLGKPEPAWQMFLVAKEALLATPQVAGGGVHSFKTVARVSRYLEALMAVAGREPAGADSPVFLVGFPRSGTTLLDQILSSHSMISVLEEKETLQDYLPGYVSREEDMRSLLDASDAELAACRERYWQRVDEYLPGRSRAQLLVDKLPLNTAFLPLIRRLFPATRIIFSVRDPRDVVLSCLMQTFALNEAMQHFLSLQETADYYCAVMDIGRRSLAALGPDAHLIRYEDLIEDAETETRRLLAFLDLPWEPALLDFQATARKRRINTPSYHQVAQPIYTDARRRWQRYAKQLEPVMAGLRPFIEYFGYS